MPTFICDRCHAGDNSACGGSFWTRLLAGDKSNGQRLCCECYTGTWHNQFPKRIFKAGDDTAGIEYIPPSLLKPTPNEHTCCRH